MARLHLVRGPLLGIHCREADSQAILPLRVSDLDDYIEGDALGARRIRRHTSSNRERLCSNDHASTGRAALLFLEARRHRGLELLRSAAHVADEDVAWPEVGMEAHRPGQHRARGRNGLHRGRGRGGVLMRVRHLTQQHVSALLRVPGALREAHRRRRSDRGRYAAGSGRWAHHRASQRGSLDHLARGIAHRDDGESVALRLHGALLKDGHTTTAALRQRCGRRIIELHGLRRPIGGLSLVGIAREGLGVRLCIRLVLAGGLAARLPLHLHHLSARRFSTCDGQECLGAREGLLCRCSRGGRAIGNGAMSLRRRSLLRRSRHFRRGAGGHNQLLHLGSLHCLRAHIVGPLGADAREIQAADVHNALSEHQLLSSVTSANQGWRRVETDCRTAQDPQAVLGLSHCDLVPIRGVEQDGILDGELDALVEPGHGVPWVELRSGCLLRLRRPP
mmetsp:Transcript_60060/g.128929  ORF Transcript_60060/g.128929 Transcript_60060/m.128929 type:complete len:449 (+) Transcript_60060:382-1728(+)